VVTRKFIARKIVRLWIFPGSARQSR